VISSMQEGLLLYTIQQAKPPLEARRNHLLN